ncbi:MAG: hypothetical protein WAM14_01000 [Candidatus Nitrosopolaris sp.]
MINAIASPVNYHNRSAQNDTSICNRVLAMANAGLVVAIIMVAIGVALVIIGAIQIPKTIVK